jgi:hypothetical protein
METEKCLFGNLEVLKMGLDSIGDFRGRMVLVERQLQVADNMLWVHPVICERIAEVIAPYEIALLVKAYVLRHSFGLVTQRDRDDLVHVERHPILPNSAGSIDLCRAVVDCYHELRG